MAAGGSAPELATNFIGAGPARTTYSGAGASTPWGRGRVDAVGAWSRRRRGGVVASTPWGRGRVDAAGAWSRRRRGGGRVDAAGAVASTPWGRGRVDAVGAWSRRRRGGVVASTPRGAW